MATGVDGSIENIRESGRTSAHQQRGSKVIGQLPRTPAKYARVCEYCTYAIIRAQSAGSAELWTKMKFGQTAALLCVIPLITLLVPALKEKAASLITLSNYLAAYEGDGILIADTSSNMYVWWWWPSIFTTRWTLMQRPVFGDAYHMISFFVAPKSLAHRFLYRFDSDYTSDYFFVDGDFMQVSQGQMHLDIRRNVYLLPQEYTPGREAKAEYTIDVKKSFSLERNETLGASICQFQNRGVFTSFIDVEPGAIDGAYKCHCDLQDPSVGRTIPPNYCSPLDSGPYFSSPKSSYNFFSTIVPTKSYVKYTANITMYFYDKLKLLKYAQYKCTIRDTDTCSFTIPQISWYYDPQVIIGYVHPKAGAFALTTTMTVDSDIALPENVALSMLCLLIPAFLIKTLFI